MGVYVVRVWVPDRPGALGAVASRIGAARGDVVAIEVLERGGGVAVDEFVVDVADEIVGLMRLEIEQVDGVRVESVRAAPKHPRDHRVDALHTAAALLECATLGDLRFSLVKHSVHDFEADWAAVVAGTPPVVMACDGEPPNPGWLAAFLAGSRASAAAAAGEAGPDDVAWAPMDLDAAIVVGRAGRPFRAVERRQLVALTAIATLHAAHLPA